MELKMNMPLSNIDLHVHLGLHRTVVHPETRSSVRLFVSESAILELLQLSPMRLALLVRGQVGLGVEPLGAWDAVVLPQTGEILYILGLLVELKMSWRGNVRGNLVQVATSPPRLGHRTLCKDTHFIDGFSICVAVFTSVKLQMRGGLDGRWRYQLAPILNSERGARFWQ